jgi:hypothetical protein
MRYLAEGHHHFRTHIFPWKQPPYMELARGQSPHYLFITEKLARKPHHFSGSGGSA